MDTKKAYFILLFMVFFSLTAFAYLDPSTMTYILQAVIGVFIAGGAAIGIYWRKIKNFFKKKS